MGWKYESSSKAGPKDVSQNFGIFNISCSAKGELYYVVHQNTFHHFVKTNVPWIAPRTHTFSQFYSKMAQNFSEHETVKIQSRPERRSIKSEYERRICSFLLKKHQIISIRMAEICLELSKSSILGVNRNRLHYFSTCFTFFKFLISVTMTLVLSFLPCAWNTLTWRHSIFNQVIFSGKIVIHENANVNIHSVKIWFFHDIS